jgi:hypothetical protein
MTGPPGTVVFRDMGTVVVTGTSGSPTEIFVVPVRFCPSDCRAVIENLYVPGLLYACVFGNPWYSGALPSPQSQRRLTTVTFVDPGETIP